MMWKREIARNIPGPSKAVQKIEFFEKEPQKDQQTQVASDGDPQDPFRESISVSKIPEGEFAIFL